MASAVILAVAYPASGLVYHEEIGLDAETCLVVGRSLDVADDCGEMLRDAETDQKEATELDGVTVLV